MRRAKSSMKYLIPLVLVLLVGCTEQRVLVNRMYICSGPASLEEEVLGKAEDHFEGVRNVR